MATLKTKDIRKSLIYKGFIEEDRDHKHYILIINNKKTSVFTKISHGKEEIDDGLIGCMAKQTRLSKKEFLDLVECPLSYEIYIQKLINQGIIKL